MNFNDVKDALAAEVMKRKQQLPVGAKEIHDAELAQQALGHPGWDLLQRHLTDQIVAANRALKGLKDQLAGYKMQPHEINWVIADARECAGRLAVLHEILEYLPGLVNKVVVAHNANQ